jgi:lipoprotein-anchoring transpeptidase ErfK/SrfK
MDRRAFLLSGLAALTATPASAEWRTRKELFNFSTSNRRRTYQGKTIVPFRTAEKPGTIIISTRKRRLFYVLPDGTAISYGVGVGRFGFTWRGAATVGRKSEWPRWIPPAEMVARDRYAAKYADGMPGGRDNPLGARALYLYAGDRDTLYRIHGTREPWTIGRAVSSGCIRMLNKDVIDLYNRVPLGTKVIVS